MHARMLRNLAESQNVRLAEHHPRMMLDIQHLSMYVKLVELVLTSLSQQCTVLMQRQSAHLTMVQSKPELLKYFSACDGTAIR